MESGTRGIWAKIPKLILETQTWQVLLQPQGGKKKKVRNYMGTETAGPVENGMGKEAGSDNHRPGTLQYPPKLISNNASRFAKKSVLYPRTTGSHW